MTVKELIRALSCFDEDHHVVINDGDERKEIAQVIFNGECAVVCED